MLLLLSPAHKNWLFLLGPLGPPTKYKSSFAHTNESRHSGHLCDIYIMAINLLIWVCQCFVLGHVKDLVVASVKLVSQ